MHKDDGSPITCLSAVTLAVTDMTRSVVFYEQLGFRIAHGGPARAFTSLRAGDGFLNLTTEARGSLGSFWGRVIFHVEDVDAEYRRAVEAGIRPEFEPMDGPWGERYFHLLDPDGHEISFARPL